LENGVCTKASTFSPVNQLLFERDPLPAWGAGRVTLLGDAAQPLLPHTSQGAVQALEDAVALALVLSPSEDVEEALRRYEKVRIPRTQEFVKLSPCIARVTTTRKLLIQSIRTLAIRLVPTPVIAWASSEGRDPHRDLRQ
jgi:2-polyprenyl-6-methoxyphenol hydroxylase-like FAD-dependent oxidoreductase